jgi:osmotically-inducible protein OsmY
MTNIFRKSALAIVLAATLSGSVFAAERSVEQQVNDARVEAQIATAITFNRHLNPFEISVEVRGDTATLTGTVDQAIDKELAERVAMNAQGVKTVSNQIAIEPGKARAAADPSRRSFSQTVEDATLTATIKSRLAWNDATDALDINVDTIDQRVTLTGTATTTQEKDTAGRLARITEGVRAVDNEIVVTPGDNPTARTTSGDPVNDSWITAKVKSSLLMSKNVDGLDLTVETKNGVVILGGQAGSTSERDLAVEIARDIRGVKDVNTSSVKIAS